MGRYNLKLPKAVQLKASRVVNGFYNSQPANKDLDEIQRWLEDEGWDSLIADLWQESVIRLGSIAQDKFEDGELRACIGVEDDEKVTDLMRISWGREQIDAALTGNDEYLLNSVHSYELKASDGRSAVVGCILVSQGHGGDVPEWQGLYKTRDDFLDDLSDGGYYWLVEKMGPVPDEVILANWQQPKPTKKRAKKR